MNAWTDDFMGNFARGLGAFLALQLLAADFVLNLESGSLATLRSFSAALRAFVNGVGFPRKAEPIFTIEIVWFAAGLSGVRFTWKEQ